LNEVKHLNRVIWNILYEVKVWAECSAFLSLLGMTWLAANGPRKSRKQTTGII